MIRRCRKKMMESIDQQIKDAMAKKVVGHTTETYKARVLELYYRATANSPGSSARWCRQARWGTPSKLLAQATSCMPLCEAV
jgi:hypothetical protein